MTSGMSDGVKCTYAHPPLASCTLARRKLCIPTRSTGSTAPCALGRSAASASGGGGTSAGAGASGASSSAAKPVAAKRPIAATAAQTPPRTALRLRLELLAVVGAEPALGPHAHDHVVAARIGAAGRVDVAVS